jgi:hypothetical protein
MPFTFFPTVLEYITVTTTKATKKATTCQCHMPVVHKPVLLYYYYLDSFVDSCRTDQNIIFVFSTSTTKALLVLFAVHSMVTMQVQVDYISKLPYFG